VLWAGGRVVFNRLYALANMPISAVFGGASPPAASSTTTLALLRASHRPANLESVMCR